MIKIRRVLPSLFAASLLLCGSCLNAAAVAVSASVYEPPALEEAGWWTLVLLPDPQTYQKFARNQPIFELMTAWIADNIDRLNIKLVLCTGDLVEQSGILDPDGAVADQTGTQQWAAVSRAFERLDNRVPCILATGNHDYGVSNVNEARRTHFDEYFSPSRNHLTQKLLRKAGTDAQGNPSLSNAAYEFISPQGRKFLILSLEFAPREAALAWGAGVMGKPAYKDHTGLLLTHTYLDSQSEHIADEDYGLTDVNYGQAIWEKLVQPSTNIEMVLSGHIASPDNPREHLGFRLDKNAAGKTVNQMAFNAQAMGGGWYGNGGDGWLRILEFHPDGKTVTVRTFSPLFAISPTTQFLAWRSEPYDQFSFTLE
jgi:hypothetical protein